MKVTETKTIMRVKTTRYTLREIENILRKIWKLSSTDKFEWSNYGECWDYVSYSLHFPTYFLYQIENKIRKQLGLSNRVGIFFYMKSKHLNRRYMIVEEISRELI